MKVFITMEGFTTPSGFILKELCIMQTDGEFNHYLFVKPSSMLTEADLRSIKYATKNLNNLSLEDGWVPYNEIKSILEKQKEHFIYTYSDIAKKVLQTYLPTSFIENIQEMGFEMPKTLPYSQCFRKHNQRYCAKAKAIAVKNFMFKN